MTLATKALLFSCAVIGIRWIILPERLIRALVLAGALAFCIGFWLVVFLVIR